MTSPTRTSTSATTSERDATPSASRSRRHSSNSLRVFRPEVYGGVKRQDYGLIGPVTVTPYGRTRVA
ncbi:hypothetical protein ACFPRL_16730 [Pseudoclavibacter helvolus]